MGRWGNVDFSQFRDFQRRLQQLEDNSIDQFCEKCAKELAARLLRKVIKRTPVGHYDDGRIGGTLRHGWSANSSREAELSTAFGGGNSPSSYINNLPIKKNGNTYEIEIINPVNYASYVEFGHRTRNHKGWVRGKFMLTVSENEIRSITPALLEKRLSEYLRGILND